jgi:peptidoglycan/LPS O-acetylase OafA/YrhL
LFQSGYFSPDAQSFPLLHLWSLGIEEQFYIVWPLLVLALGNRHRWIVAIGLLGSISFVLCVTLSEHREFDFFSPFTRTWELMVGAVLAWFARGASAGVGWRPLAVESATFLGFGLHHT